MSTLFDPMLRPYALASAVGSAICFGWWVGQEIMSRLAIDSHRCGRCHGRVLNNKGRCRLCEFPNESDPAITRGIDIPI